MKILITGAKGLLGSELSRLAKLNGYKVLATDKDELDIRIEQEVEDKISKFKPGIIVNCAAEPIRTIIGFLAIRLKSSICNTAPMPNIVRAKKCLL